MTQPFLSSEWHDDLVALAKEHSADIMGGLSTGEVMRPVIDLAIRNHGYALVHVWSVDPRRGRLVLVAQGANKKLNTQPTDVLDVSTSYTGLAYETGQRQFHSSLTGLDGRCFVNAALRQELNLQSMLSLPIRNMGNPHQITMVVNLCCDRPGKKEPSDHEIETAFRPLSGMLAASFESNLRERSFRMSARVSQALGRLSRLTSESGCQTFAETVCKALETDWVTVYLENWNASRLTKAADTLEKSTLLRQSAGQADALIPRAVEEVWRSNRELLLPHVDATEAEMLLHPAEPIRPASAILVPLHDVRGQCRGVIRCVNFVKALPLDWRRRHSYEDIAVVEAMERAFAPPLEMILQSQVQDRSLSNLAHELRVPVVALKAVHERMEREYEKGKVWFKFRFPYFKEVHTFTGIMQRLLRELEITRIGPERLKLDFNRVNLLSEVIQPAFRHLEPILKLHGMQLSQITHNGFDDLPVFNADVGFLVQVVFNLLENMVKYYPKKLPSHQFQGKVTCERMFGRVEIVFEDNGKGIAEEDRERIFEHGYRSEGAKRSHVQGTGLGCWLAREIARQHGGDVFVRSIMPFQIVLMLQNPRLKTIQGL
jgi:signal transduction histidine kinase